MLGSKGLLITWIAPSRKDSSAFEAAPASDESIATRVSEKFALMIRSAERPYAEREITLGRIDRR